MLYSKQQLSWTRSTVFRSAEPACRGVWTSLNGYCADQENGGRIIGCATWSDRQWFACCDATRAEVEATIAAGLARLDGNDLILEGYDAVGEATYQATQTVNRDKANLRWAKQRADADAAAQAAADAAASKPAPARAPAPAHAAAMPIPVHSTPDQSMPVGESTPAPAVGRSVSDGERILKVLMRLGLPATPKAVTEWGVMLGPNGIGGCRDIDEIAKALVWCVETARARKMTVTYSQHAPDLAMEWDSRKHQEVDA